MDLSIIVPVFNEEDNVKLLYDSIVAAVEPLGISFEILFVDDGSRDETFARSARLARDDTRLRVVKLRRNYGQTPAMVAGIDQARGDLLITMDGDLQNDPADIPMFVDKIADGYDIVVGWRRRRHDKLVTRIIPSKIANWLISRVTGVPIKDNGCSLKAYQARLIKNIPLYSEMHRFIPAMASLAGAKVFQVEVNHHARRFGTSKYGLSRIYKVIFDLISIKTILTFSGRSLFWFMCGVLVLGILSVLGFLYGVAGIVLNPAAGQAGLIGLSALFGALSFFLLLLGVLSQLILQSSRLRAETFSTLTATLVGAYQGPGPSVPEAAR